MLLVKPFQHQAVPPQGGGGAQHLQRLLVLMPISLLLAVMIFAASTGFPDSISSYHQGPYRDVFVAAMIGTAVALLGYWGVTPIEDYSLNVAGFYAVIVALVPNDIAAQIGELTEAPPGPVAPRVAVQVTLGAVLLIAGAFVFIDYTRGAWSTGWLVAGPLKALTITSVSVLVLYALWLLINVFNPNTTFPWIHLPAAGLLFVHLGLAVAAQGWQWLPQPSPPGQGRQRLYRLIVWGMVLAVPAILLLGWWLKLSQTVLVLEVVEVLLFAVFWASELGRFWTTSAQPAGAP